MTAATAVTVPREARPVRRHWLHLAAPGTPAVFDPAMLGDLPEPARRWLAHSIAPRTPLWQAVELSMRGHIRIGRWHPFTAVQVLAPPHGYIWAATVRMAGLPLTGYDRLTAGSGEMRWRLLRLVPVMTADGADITRSACGRLAAEIALIPTVFTRAAWASGSDPGTATATWRFGEDTETVRLRVGDDGRLAEATLNRWGNPGDSPFGRYPFGMSADAEAPFSGVTIPTRFRAGWWWGTGRQPDGEFFRARITGAVFR